MPSVYHPLPPTPTPAPRDPAARPLPLIPLITTTSTAGSAHAMAQARYRYKNADREREKARERMRKRRGDDPPPLENFTPAELRALSSKELRASRTFAGFRDYIREFMFWVVVDKNSPEDIAAYNRFMSNNSPSPDLSLPLEDVEFLFRHIYPEPQGVDVEEEDNARD